MESGEWKMKVVEIVVGRNRAVDRNLFSMKTGRARFGPSTSQNPN